MLKHYKIAYFLRECTLYCTSLDHTPYWVFSEEGAPLRRTKLQFTAGETGGVGEAFQHQLRFMLIYCHNNGKIHFMYATSTRVPSKACPATAIK